MVGNLSDGQIVSFGEMLIDFLLMVSGVLLVEAPGFLKAPGGAPANVAIVVARLGGRAAFVGKLSDDECSHMLAGILTENGVSDSGVSFDQGARTALAFVTLRAELEFMFYRNPSAGMLLAPHELNFELIKCIKYATCLARSFHGAATSYHVKTVDTTGAGDAFVGSLLCDIVYEHSIIEDDERLKQLLKYACACGALTTIKKGAIPALAHSLSSLPSCLWPL